MRVVVVYPQVAEAIAEYRQKKGLPSVVVEELRYGLDEVMQLVNLFPGSQLLTGKNASIFGLLEILAEPVDILWILTHGVDEGWFLNDGLVNASETTALIRSSGIFLTVMNTCSSREVARDVASELGTAFIATITEIPDRQAFITGVLFARQLSKGLDYTEAWKMAKPGQKHPYVLIEAKKDMPTSEGRGKIEEVEGNGINYARLSKAIDDLDLMLNGSTRLDVPGVKGTLKNLTDSLSDFKNQYRMDSLALSIKLDQIQSKQTLKSNTIVAMSIVIVILLIVCGILSNQLLAGGNF